MSWGVFTILWTWLQLYIRLRSLGMSHLFDVTLSSLFIHHWKLFETPSSWKFWCRTRIISLCWSRIWRFRSLFRRFWAFWWLSAILLLMHLRLGRWLRWWVRWWHRICTGIMNIMFYTVLSFSSHICYISFHFASSFYKFKSY